jgi:hypothetical protein
MFANVSCVCYLYAWCQSRWRRPGEGIVCGRLRTYPKNVGAKANVARCSVVCSVSVQPTMQAAGVESSAAIVVMCWIVEGRKQAV